VGEAAAGGDDRGRRRLDAQLHDRRAGGDRPARRGEILDDRVHPHRMRALPSRVSGSSPASASYSATWKEPGPCAPAAASSPATPNATSASTAASSGSSGRTARKQPVIADDMQPVPVMLASS